MTYESFCREFFELSNIDLSKYRKKQMKRRIDSFIFNKKQFTNYQTFYKSIQTDLKKFEEFNTFLTINVTEFFRNPVVWTTLTQKVLPEIIEQKRSLKIWSAGCSTGEEPYTMAMIMANEFPEVNYSIIATDLDKNVLEFARSGEYSLKAHPELSPEILSSHFRSIDKETVAIKDALKKNIHFTRLNLLEDRFPQNVDLIICRNVVIYFTEESKTKLYTNFNQSLSDEGYLMIGSTENILHEKRFGFQTNYPCLLKKHPERSL